MNLQQQQQTRVRFAPSPTGDLHLGSIMTMLANRAFADTAGGKLVLRIDDTDRERSTPELVDSILDELEWMQLAFDEGPYFQAVRDNIHREQLERLLDDGVAYHCFCSEERLDNVREQQQRAGLPPRYDETCRDLSGDEVAGRINLGEHPVVRLRVPHDETYGFVDMIHGSVAAPAGSFGDFVLARADGTATYLFASVCDDIDLGITHIIRGEDHLANTPRQLALFDALNVPAPAFAHLPLLRSPGGKKLSKREPMGTLRELRESGYLPGTIRTYLSELLGLEPGADALRAGLRLEQVRAGSSPQVDAARLASVGRDSFAALSPDEIAAMLDNYGVSSGDRLLPFAVEVAPGCATVTELLEQVGSVTVAPTPDIVLQGMAELRESLAVKETMLPGMVELLSTAAKVAARASTADELISEWKAAVGIKPGPAMRALRMLLTGRTGGSPLPLVVATIGIDEIAERVAALQVDTASALQG